MFIPMVSVPVADTAEYSASFLEAQLEHDAECGVSPDLCGECGDAGCDGCPTPSAW